MLNFLKEINIRDVRETNLKLIFGLGSVVYAAFGILLNTSEIHYNDPLWLRLIILALSIISLVLSFYYEPVKRHAIKVLFGNLYAYNAHLYYLLFVNDFQPSYKLALLVVTFASILFIQDKKMNKIYLVANTITHCTILIATQSLTVENISVLLLVFMVLFIGYFTNRERIDAFQQIRDREAILNSINNNVHHGIFRTNADDETIYANENFARMLGYDSLAEMQHVKKPFQFAVPEQARQINVQKMSKAFINDVEAEIKCRDNTTIWVLLSLSPFLDPVGNLRYYDGAIIDITARKKAEKNLTLFSAAIEHSTTCVAITDQSGYIRYTNPFFAKVTGYDFSELSGTKIQSYIAQDSPFLGKMRSELKTGRVWKGELNHKNKSGDTITLLVSIAPIYSGVDDITNFVIVAEDITERKIAERELIVAKEQAESAHKAQEQFLSTISHELRTPMNAVIGISNLMLEENPRADQAENLKILQFSANNLLALINDVLDLTKIEAGKLDMIAQDFDIGNTLSDINKSHRIKANDKGVELNVNIDRNVPKILVGDAHRLSQVLNNLVGNAVKFTDKGRVEINVKALKSAGDDVEIGFTVKDTGIGIPADKVLHIFEPFSQASALTNRIYGGTGLGLAITRKLIELQGGKISVLSETGKGSTFIFNILFKKSDKDSLPKETVVRNFSGLRGIRILLVEDNKVNQKVANKFLTNWEAVVDTVDNGKEALDWIKANHYDVVLMDLLMPVMDGYEAIRRIRKMPEYSELPVIALTASAMSHEREKAFEAGVTDYICKPFVPSELYSKIAKYVYSDINSKIEAA